EAERTLGLDVEPRLQQLMLPYPRVLHTLSAAYAVANVGLTVGWLVLMFRQRHPDFHRLRRTTVLATMAAQPVFLFFPCAPPRRLDHIVDTIADVTGVDLESGLIGQLYIPIAAMPSIHVTYAVITGHGLAQTSRSPLVRSLGKAYATLVAFVVFVTGNHYVLDAIVGGMLGGVALRTAHRLSRLSR
ncbi:MAG: phosphatase PAP2 family protein, partial [Gaiellales bacterium]